MGLRDIAPLGKSYRYELYTEENGPLSKFELGDPVEKTVRPMTCIYKGEQGFAIYEVEEGDRRFTITGSFPYELVLNSFYRVIGNISVDKRGNKQIKVSSCESVLPVSKQGIITVLQTLHGLDTQAYKLYDILGSDVLELIKKDPATVVSKVKGVGIKRAKIWQQDLLSRSVDDAEIQKLYTMGITPSQATRLIADHSIAVCNEIVNNPYLLMDYLPGSTFRQCDELALGSNHQIRDPERIQRGIQAVLESVKERGHTTYPKAPFMKVVHQRLDIILNQQDASRYLRLVGSNRAFSFKVGRFTYTVSSDDLAQDMQEWRMAGHSRGEVYQYIVDRIEDDLLEQALGELQAKEMLRVDCLNERQYITPHIYFRAEDNIAYNLRNFVASEYGPFKTRDETITKVLEETGVMLEPKQYEAVERICTARGGIFILNGSAGCGKTFTLKIIVKVLTQLYANEDTCCFSPCVLAPTGKASKVAAKSTGLKAKTIHRALGLVADMKDAVSGTITNNCVIVDEFSMVDELLCSRLFSGITTGTKIILLGDTEQLPSIRAGRVLKDIIASGIVPVITLDAIKRQSAHSGILINANRIIRGEMISTCANNPQSMADNAYIVEVPDIETAKDKVLGMAERCGLGNFQAGNVQVLCPLQAGQTGVIMLNYLLQQTLNPNPQDEIIVGKIAAKSESGVERGFPKSFRVGDCVIHTKNNYDQPWIIKDPAYGYREAEPHGMCKGVVNGDTGVIEHIDTYKDGSNTTHRVIYVKYDDHYISYDNDFDELSLAYALTIHKSQGSQWPVVICPIVQQTMLLNRKLLYTMYTRAQMTSILIGRGDLIYHAIQNDREDKRLTLLTERIAKKL